MNKQLPEGKKMLVEKYINGLNQRSQIEFKNISKDLLMKLVSSGCKINIHINTDDNKVESRIYVFESAEGSSYIYTSGGKFSDGGLFDSVSTVIEMCYGAEEKNSFYTAKSGIIQGTVGVFHSVDLDDIILLAEKGEIAARITERKIPKITEMYGAISTEDGQASAFGEQMYDESTSSSSIKLDELDDVNIDIDFGDEIAVRKNVELEAEKEAKKEQKESR